MFSVFECCVTLFNLKHLTASAATLEPFSFSLSLSLYSPASPLNVPFIIYSNTLVGYSHTFVLSFRFGCATNFEDGWKLKTMEKRRMRFLNVHINHKSNWNGQNRFDLVAIFNCMRKWSRGHPFIVYPDPDLQCTHRGFDSVIKYKYIYIGMERKREREKEGRQTVAFGSLQIRSVENQLVIWKWFISIGWNYLRGINWLHVHCTRMLVLILTIHRHTNSDASLAS